MLENCSMYDENSQILLIVFLFFSFFFLVSEFVQGVLWYQVQVPLLQIVTENGDDSEYTKTELKDHLMWLYLIG